MAMDPEEKKRRYPGLRSISELPPEEQLEIRRRAAKTTNEKYKQRKKLGEQLIALLMNDGLQENMCLSMIKAVIEDHNASAFVAIRDTIGEKPVDFAVNVGMSDEEARIKALEEARAKLGIGGEYDGEGEAESAFGESAEGETVVPGEDPDSL